MSEQRPSIDLETVWYTFHDQLFGFARRRVASDDDAEDIVQDVFARVQARSGDGARIQNVSGWVFQITRNAVIDYHRARAKAWRVASALERDPEHDSVDASPMHDASGELARCLRPFVDHLPGRYTQALALRDLGGMPQAEAARRLGLSGSGMKSRVQQGRTRLKALMLESCDMDLDGRRHVVDYRRRSPVCGDCR
jgi:RNA polymerase sigma-70 factor (ECF subfamily)